MECSALQFNCLGQFVRFIVTDVWHTNVLSTCCVSTCIIWRKCCSSILIKCFGAAQMVGHCMRKLCRCAPTKYIAICNDLQIDGVGLNKCIQLNKTLTDSIIICLCAWTSPANDIYCCTKNLLRFCPMSFSISQMWNICTQNMVETRRDRLTTVRQNCIVRHRILRTHIIALHRI